MYMKQDTRLSYICGASLFCGAALNIETLQPRWTIFNSFHITEDGKTPFVLKLNGIGVLFIRDGSPPEKYTQRFL